MPVIGSTEDAVEHPALEEAAGESTCDPREQAAAATAQLDERNVRSSVESRNSGGERRIVVIKSEHRFREGGSRARIVITGIRRIHLSDNRILGSDDRCRIFFSRNHGRG